MLNPKIDRSYIRLFVGSNTSNYDDYLDIHERIYNKDYKQKRILDGYSSDYLTICWFVNRMEPDNVRLGNDEIKF